MNEEETVLYDYDEKYCVLSDSVIYNNGDVERVFVTIAYCLNHFFKQNVKAVVFLRAIRLLETDFIAFKSINIVTYGKKNMKLK